MQQVTLFGINWDGNSSFSKGPALAPDTIRKALFEGSLNRGTENGFSLANNANWSDAGNLTPSATGNFVKGIEKPALTLLKHGKRLLTLGGDHSISYPLLRAYSQVYPELTIVHLDAHSDLYHEFKGNKLSNACPFARIMEEKLGKALYQYGIRTLNEHQRQQAEKFKVKMVQMKDWLPGQVPDIGGPVYLSLDVDAIDPAYAPGVSHREPGGFSSREVINFIHQLPGELVGCDLVEFNPLQDMHNLTANLCAKLVKELAGKMLTSI